MPKYSGLASQTPQHILLDAGSFYRNYDLAQPYESQKDKRIGATAGGGSFSAVQNSRQIDVDGKRGPVKGLDEPEDWDVTMTANVKEITADNLALALSAADVTDVSTPTTLAGYKKVSGRTEFKETDYSDNITWIGRVLGNQKPIIIVIYNALAINGVSLNHGDKSEGVVPITLRASFDDCESERVPFDIFYPPVN